MLNLEIGDAVEFEDKDYTVASIGYDGAGKNPQVRLLRGDNETVTVKGEYLAVLTVGGIPVRDLDDDVVDDGVALPEIGSAVSFRNVVYDVTSVGFDGAGKNPHIGLRGEDNTTLVIKGDDLKELKGVVVAETVAASAKTASKSKSKGKG